MTEIAEPETSERSKVESWRLHVLIEAGYPLSARRAPRRERGRPASRGRARRQRLRARDRRRDPALDRARPPHAAEYAGGREQGRAAPLRRPHRLLGRELQPRRRAVARQAADALGRGRGDGAEAPRRAGRASSSRSRIRADGSCVGVTMQRGKFDALRLDLADGERVHVFGRPELFEQRGDYRMRALIDRALRRRRAPRRARAAEDEARGRRASSPPSGSARCRCCRGGSGSSPATTPPRSAT